MLFNILFEHNIVDLSFEISSKPTLNPHRLTVSLEKSSALVLLTAQSIENVLTKLPNRHETSLDRFLAIA